MPQFLYYFDIINRHEDTTLTVSNGGSLITWTLRDDEENVIGSARGLVDDDETVLKKLRRQLGIDDNVLPMLYAGQRDLVNVKDGQCILNVDTETNQIKTYSGWV